ncbi:MAG: 5-deoxy-glucuronate isomerase [Acidobacteriia bacterium]|nr:5-deoxy-glucuronate isomerase [Terriglobia bacterium]
MATYTQQAVSETLVFRKTNTHLGRHLSVTPANSTNRHLAYGRIILSGEVKSAAFYTADRETSLIVLAGEARVDVAGQQFDLTQYDGIYIPRDCSVHVRTDGNTDIAEFSADVSEHYPLQVVRYSVISQDPSLKFTAGAPTQQRSVNIVIGKNVNAGRLVAGFTFSEPGNWTSWPPHEHAAMLEEMYVYFAMPEPAFGIQLVYNNTEHPELVTVVRDGDAVLMPSGYHPNVSVPGHRINFLWAMAAHREKVDRQFGVVNVQPGFAAGGTGLEASRK